MSADFDVVLFAEADGFVHDEGVAGVEAAGDVGDVDEGEEGGVGAAFEVAEAFAEVDVEEGFVLDGTHGGVFADLIVLTIIRLKDRCF